MNRDGMSTAEHDALEVHIRDAQRTEAKQMALTLTEASGDTSKLGTVADFLRNPEMAEVASGVIKNGGRA